MIGDATPNQGITASPNIIREGGAFRTVEMVPLAATRDQQALPDRAKSTTPNSAVAIHRPIKDARNEIDMKNINRKAGREAKAAKRALKSRKSKNTP